MTENFLIMTWKTLFNITLLGLFMRLLGFIKIVNSRLGVRLVNTKNQYYSTVTEWICIVPLVNPWFHVSSSPWNSNPTNSSIKKNTLNDNRSFIFLSIIFMREKGGFIKRFQIGWIRVPYWLIQARTGSLHRLSQS